MAVPAWSDKISVVSLAKVVKGGKSRGTLNLYQCFGGYVFLRVGRLTANAPAVGIQCFVRRLLYDNANSRVIPHNAPLFAGQDGTTAANLTTLSGAISGGNTVPLTATTGFTSDLQVVMVDSASTPTIAEWHRTSLLSGSNLTMDAPIVNGSIGNGYTITNQALNFGPVWVDGGAQYNQSIIEVIFDYGKESSGSAVDVVVEAWAQTLTGVA